MNKLVVIMLFIFELVGILAFDLHIAREKANRCSDLIHFPVNMVLTLNQDVSISADDGVIVIAKGTEITPRSNYDNEVHYMIDGCDNLLISSWDCFVEQDQLMKLKTDAETRKSNNQKSLLKQGATKGIVKCLVWLIIGVIFSFWLIKGKKIKLLIIGHGIVTVIIGSGVLISALMI